MWRYAAARTTGTSHLKIGAPCQDRFACFADEHGLVIAVADGAGSASRAEVGAQIAVTAAIEILRAYLSADVEDWRRCVVHAAHAARDAVLARAENDLEPPREYAATLLLLIATPSGGAALQLGDGVIAYRDQDGWAPLFWPQKGEYANMTRFITDDNAQDMWQIASLPVQRLDFAVMTDGLEGLALHFATRSVHEPFFEVSTALEGFLGSPRITDRADDDLTLCIATPV
jgi:serine/threonine protein phosphatase PrpC